MVSPSTRRIKPHAHRQPSRAGFLFSTIGITASDFFCPNLATVADRLGLGESTAGVTFLAFGNGSPDVFSTFSALKSDSFALAIGELLGASAFITSIVVGSMALVQPFHVPRWPFLRDVGFFTCAVMILVACLKDGKLTLPETGGLVGMYVLYVGIVVGGNWWHARRKQDATDRGKAVLGQDEDGEDYFSQRGSVESRRPSAATLEQTELLKPTDAFLASRSRSVSNASNVSTGTTPLPLSRQSSHGTITHAHHAHATRPQIDAPRPTFSLLGAIEFRDAINALRKESAAAAAADQGTRLVDAGQLSGQLDDLLGEPSVVADYFGGASPYPSGHYHSFAHGHGHHHSRVPGGRSPSRPGHSRQVSSFQRLEGEQGTIPALGARRLEPSRVESTPAMAGGNLQARVHDVRRASADAIRDLGRREGVEGSTNEQAASATTSLRDVEPDSIPLISSGNSGNQPKQTEQSTWQRTAHHVLHILFPALQGFREKSIPGKILGIFASPAILALTLTLPVVDDSAEGVALNQGGVALGEDDEAATESEDGRFGMQADAERGIVHHTSDASGEDSQTVMGQAGWDLHRRVLAPGEVGSPDGDKDVREQGEACSVESEEEVLLFNKYLTAVQSVLGTLFCSCVIFCEHPQSRRWPELTPLSGKLGGQIHHPAPNRRRTHPRCRHPDYCARRHGPNMALDPMLCGILFGHVVDRSYCR
jgi:sodium/potassium/calcium exchanger 6